MSRLRLAWRAAHTPPWVPTLAAAAGASALTVLWTVAAVAVVRNWSLLGAVTVAYWARRRRARRIASVRA